MRPISTPFSKAFKTSASVMLTACILASNVAVVPSFAEPLKGEIRVDKNAKTDPTVNFDDVKEIPDGATLDMVLSTEVSPGVSVDGDEFFGKVSKDYVVDGKVVIPRDTLVHGMVENMVGPKRAGRNGYINTKFDYMITPDGREIPIEGGNTTRDSKGKAAAKIVGRAAGYTAMGGVVGALMVVKYGGISAIAASEGYALAGGAAIGGVAGLTAAMIRKGKSAMLKPGAEIRVKLAEGLSLPTMNMPDASADDFTLEGLEVKVLGMRIGTDPFGEPNEMTLTVDIRNSTENTFSTFEIGLEDEYGSIFYPSPFGDTGMWFSKIGPNSKGTSNISFNVDNPKLRYKLVFFKQYTREPLAKIAITDGMMVDKKQAKQLKKQVSQR